jgi:hypothetical protein
MARLTGHTQKRPLKIPAKSRNWALPDKEILLPIFPLLRTVLATFAAHGSSKLLTTLSAKILCLLLYPFYHCEFVGDNTGVPKSGCLTRLYHPGFLV